MPSPSHHPHDRFFKGAFSMKELMVEYLREFVPQEISKNFHLDSLEQQKESYLDKNLEEYFSDVIYTVRYGKSKVKVTLLLEHKSYLPPYPWLQLLQYMVNAYTAQTKQPNFSGAFHVVIPIVVYHGQRHWKIRSIQSYFEGIDSHLTSFVPEFDYILHDLNQYDQTELLNKEGRLVSGTFLALKYGSVEDEEERVKLMLEGLLRALHHPNHTNLFHLTFVYLVKIGTSREVVMKTLENMESPIQEKVVSVYDQILNEGKLQSTFTIFKQGVSMGMPLTDLLTLTGVNKETATRWYDLLKEDPTADLPTEE